MGKVGGDQWDLSLQLTELRPYPDEIKLTAC